MRDEQIGIRAPVSHRQRAASSGVIALEAALRHLMLTQMIRQV
jgi:hypothetical protein